MKDLFYALWFFWLLLISAQDITKKRVSKIFFLPGLILAVGIVYFDSDGWFPLIFGKKIFLSLSLALFLFVFVLFCEKQKNKELLGMADIELLAISFMVFPLEKWAFSILLSVGITAAVLGFQKKEKEIPMIPIFSISFFIIACFGG